MHLKKIIFTMVLLLFLFSSSAITFAYMSETENLDSSVSITVQGKQFKSQESSWDVHTYDGLPFLKYNNKPEHEPYDLGVLNGLPVISSPNSFPTNFVLLNKDGKKIFEGPYEKFKTYRIKDNGIYDIIVTLDIPKSDNQSHGTAHFCFTSNIALTPKISLSATSVVQGDVLAVKVTNVPASVTPTVTTNLGMATFTGDYGTYLAYVPVGYLKPVGGYKLNVVAGNAAKEFTVMVTDGKFKKQYMTINKSNPSISEASSPKAYQQYRDKIYPLYKTADTTRYWTGAFTQPVHGRITTQFGLTRYTNGSSTPDGHGALDIAAVTGTPVLSPAPGRVVFSEYLLNTGNTIVIEHGGGLKSYYYHMSSRAVNVDDTVAQAQKIGAVGSTGYSTGAHLHFEVKIGDQSINPWSLINGTGGCFAN